MYTNPINNNNNNNNKKKKINPLEEDEAKRSFQN